MLPFILKRIGFMALTMRSRAERRKIFACET